MIGISVFYIQSEVFVFVKCIFPVRIIGSIIVVTYFIKVSVVVDDWTFTIFINSISFKAIIFYNNVCRGIIYIDCSSIKWGCVVYEFWVFDGGYFFVVDIDCSCVTLATSACSFINYEYGWVAVTFASAYIAPPSVFALFFVKLQLLTLKSPFE